MDISSRTMRTGALKPRSRFRALARIAPFDLWGSRGASLVFLMFALALLALSVLRPAALEDWRGTVADRFAPVLEAVSYPFARLSEFVGGVTGMAALRAENMQLSRENARLREWYQTALMLQAENQSLKDLLRVKVDPRHSFISARVIADAGGSYVRSVLVGAGRDDGVGKGQAVLAGEGLVGRVVETGREAARVLLLTDYNSRVPVTVEGSRQRAILAGDNADAPVLLYLPPDSNPPDGARIVTSGIGGVFPAGLPVGVVASGPEGRRSVRLFADVSRIMHVRIVSIPEDPNLLRGQPVNIDE